MTDDTFDMLFERFKAILEPYAGRLYVAADAPGYYGVDLAPEAERSPSTWFAGTRKGKRYVSYYLMPVYIQPGLLDGISPELRRRMQGKSCFNLSRVDEDLLVELEALTAKGYAATAGDPAWATPVRDAPTGERNAARRAKAAATPD